MPSLVFRCCQEQALGTAVSGREQKQEFGPQEGDLLPDDAEDELLMPEPMLQTYFSRVKRHLRDLERGTSAPLRLTQFQHTVDRCHELINKERAAVIRSYHKSKQLLKQEAHRQEPAEEALPNTG